jgi:S-DNA-T family DNA segregation ATPase FtsK/SpoIIIE
MSSLSVSQIMAAKFRTSIAADGLTKEIMENMGLTTKAAVARLAIGRSLGAGALPATETVDARGLEIPASSLFKLDDIHAWVGLLLTHEFTHSQSVIGDMDSFRNLVRRHWHRGVHLLDADWRESGGQYNSFLSTLITRRADLVDGEPIAPTPGGDDNNNNNNNGVKNAQNLSDSLSKLLSELGIPSDVKGCQHGPRVSRYKVVLKDLSKYKKLERSMEQVSLALNLNGAIPTVSYSDEAKAVNLDVPRPRESWENIGAIQFERILSEISANTNKILVTPGTDIMGEPIIFDLAAAPHLLVGGATGKGKSVCVHALLLSVIKGHSPASMKLALIDPKQVEFAVYEKSKLLWQNRIISGVEDARSALDMLTAEMDNRYTSMRQLNVTGITDARQSGLDLPYILVCIDELADLLMQDDEVEGLITRLAQMGRAAGIHLIIATQRPDAKTVSGLIRSNVPSRIALTVQKGSESDIILDERGAENLLGFGDMIVKLSGEKARRGHGYNLNIADVKRLIK